MANHTSLASLFTDIANAIRAKLGSNASIVADNFPAAIQSIAPTLETVSKTYTPSTSQQSDTITPGQGYDGIDEVDVTINAIPEAEMMAVIDRVEYSTSFGQRYAFIYPSAYCDYAGWVSEGTVGTVYPTSYNAIPTGTSVTPTESAQTIGGSDYMMEGAVTVNAIPSNYVGSGVPQKSSSDLTASGDTVSAPAGYYPNGASKAVQSGTEGTPTATKGAVNNHAVTVTPAVTNAAGYIQGGTHSGTPVTVSASELVSGSETKTQNGTYDVTNLAELVVNVSGGGGSSMMVSTATKTLAAAASSIQFTGLSGEPTSFVVTSAADQSTGGTKVVAVVYDGTSCHGIDLTTQAEADTGFTQSYSNGTLTITATTASFQANEYKLVYSYGGTGGNIGTADVQVGSGATSITFTGLSDEPEYFSCIFKSTFSTSNGYQRVMEVVYDGTNIYGHALDSSAHALTSWTWSYNNGSLTITSTGTNNGGYFHQPGYYQLTYAIGGDQTLQTKTVTPTEQTQNVTADTAQGYTALKKVVVNPIPSQYVVPSGNLPITQNGNNIDVTNYASVSVNVSGGGSGGTVGTGSATLQSAGNSISFTNLSGTPKAWFIRCTTQVSSSGSTTYYYIVDARYNGTNTQGTLFRIGNTRRIQNQTSGLSYTYSNGTLTITSTATSAGATPGFFYNGTYELTYVY